MWAGFKDWFIRHLNWCEGPDETEAWPGGHSRLKLWFFWLYAWLYWPLPWREQPCWCCASVRGIFYGLLLGLLAWYFWG